MIKILPHESVDVLSKYKNIIEETDSVKFTGRVVRVSGQTIESIGPSVHYGEICKIKLENDVILYSEVVGFNKNRVILMPIGELKGVVPGADVIALGSALKVSVGDELLGRVINGVGEPLDDKGRIFTEKQYPVDGQAINPLERRQITKPISVGINAIDGLLSVGKGQRIGIFSGSGVGKSTLMCMIARNTSADVNVVALIGERGREVKDFVVKELGEEGLKRSVVVVATSDQPPLIRLRGAYLAHAIAEYFRDEGKDVNILMDSITRFCMAQREVGLAAGEVSATRGYPPSVFSIMPKMLERAGTRSEGGSITGFYTILVEADDMNEPISDAVRGSLDGHIVLDRSLAHKGHYPAIDILGSISRCMKDIIDDDHKSAADQFRELLAAYKDKEDLILLNAYPRGSDPVVDKALDMIDIMNTFLQQGIHDRDTFEGIRNRLLQMFSTEESVFGSQQDAIQRPYFAPVRNQG